MEPFDRDRSSPPGAGTEPSGSTRPRSGRHVDGPRQPLSGEEFPGHDHAGDQRHPEPHPAPARVPDRAGVSLRSILGVLFSHWRLIFFVGAVVLAAAAAAVVYLPPHYASQAKLLVRLGRESVVIDPTARIGQAAVPMEGRDKEINSEIELLKSRKLTEAVVRQIGPNRLLGRPVNQPPDAKTFSDAVTLVEDKLVIEAIPESNILSIRFEARDPQLARDFVADLIESYLDERADIYRDRGDLKFFQDQVATARSEQNEIQRKLQQLRDSTGVSDTTQQRAALVTRIAQIKTDIDTDTAARDAQRAELDAVTSQVGSATATQQRASLVANDSRLESLIKSLKTELSDSETNLAWVNEVDVKSQKLQGEATLSAARVTQYAEAYEQARIDQAMGKERLSNISIAEPPVLPLSPKSPNRMLLAIAGGFLALTLGLGSAFAAEAVDRTVRRAEDLHQLGVARVISIPSVADELIEPAAEPGRNGSPADASPAASSRGRSAPVAPLRTIGVHPNVLVPSQPQGGLTGAPRFRPVAGTIVSAVDAVPAAGKSPDRSAAAATDPDEPNQSALSVIDLAIRPARPAVISPRVLSASEGVLERLISADDGFAPPTFIGVVGPRPGQGASTIALHLAVSLARRMDGGADAHGRQRVLLFDADVESNASSAMAGVRFERSGLGNPLSRGVEPTNTPELPGRRRPNQLDVFSAGMLREISPAAIQMPQMMRAIGRRYRHVVIDLPSLVENEASARIAGLCGAVVLVWKANSLRVEIARQTLDRLHEVNANVAVAVLNQRRYPVPEWIYQRAR